MPGSRDDFSTKDISTLALRVSHLCSNPGCRRTTSGPNYDPHKATIVGEAAHITAASPGGPRFDPSLTQSERGGIGNAIWLCPDCATLIDKDWHRFPTQLLNEWKLQAEAYADMRLISGPPPVAGWSASNVVLTNQIDALSVHVSSGLSKELDAAKQIRMEGRWNEARAWVIKVKEDKHAWQVLPPSLQAKVTGFEANLLIDEGIDLERARELISKAKCIDPQYDAARLLALAEYKVGSPDGAIDLLKNSENPLDRQFCAAMELQRGNPDSCLAFITSLEDKENPESLRLRALASLLKKDPISARSLILAAESREPKWQAILFAKAAINYWCAVSPIAIPDQPLSSPEPIEWSLVKQDDHSQNLLADAAVTIDLLIDLASTSTSERNWLEGWRLAALANTINRQKEATAYCQQLILNQPNHKAAIAWAVTRIEDVDLSLSLRILEEGVENDELSANDILSLVSIYFANERFDDATALLNRCRDSFLADDARVAWHSCLAQSYTLAGRPKDALKLIDEAGLSSELVATRLSALRRLSHEEGSTTELQTALDDLFKTTHDSRYLLDRCRLAAFQKDWLFIAESGAELISSVGTPDMVRLVATSYYNTTKYQECLNLLESNTAKFKNEELPPELRKLRTLSRAELGYLSQAVMDAEDLVRSEGKIEDIVRLIDLLLQKGDFHSIAREARGLLTQPDLSVHDALWVANVIRSEDKACAARLWRHALGAGIPDELVADAVYLAFRLGLDREANALFGRMNAFAAQGKYGVEVKSLTDLKLLLKKHREDANRINELYRTGAAPIHMLSDAANDSLVNIYHSYQVENETVATPHSKAPLFIRNGRKAVVAELSTSISYGLHMDLTAILIAAHLDILDLVEASFHAIYFPQHLQRVLAEMRAALEHLQPGRLDDLRTIARRIEQGDIQVVDDRPGLSNDWGELSEKLDSDWLALLERAQSEDGYVLDFLPIRHKNLNGETVSLPSDIEPNVINIRALADLLRFDGIISSATHSAILRRAGSESVLERDVTQYQKRSVIFCHANTPELLASVGLIDPCVGNFKIFVEQSEAERIKRELAHEAAQVEVRRWLDTLIDHIRNGIDSGKWKPLATGTIKPDSDEPFTAKGATLQSLLDLLGANYAAEDLVWIDDRYVSAYDSVGHGTGRIVGVTEILRLLRAKKLLNDESYFGILHRLRSSNVRFLPVEKEEVLHFLKEAVIRNDQVQETHELKTLRRYFASCLLASDCFVKPPKETLHSFDKGEFQFLLRQMAMPDDAIIAVWADTSVDEATCQAWCEWILENLAVDPAGLVKVASIREIKDDEKHLKVSHLTGYIVRAFAEPNWIKSNERRRACLKWLYERVLQRKFQADPFLRGAAVEYLRRHFVDLIEDKSLEPNERKALAVALQWFYLDLPSELSEEFVEDQKLLSLIGIVTRATSSLGDLTFEHNGFISAIRCAIAGSEPVLKSDSGIDVQFRAMRGEKGYPIVQFFDSRQSDWEACDAVLGLLSDSVDDRERILRSHRSWFDCSANEYEERVARIVSIDDPHERVKRADDIRKASMSYFYSKTHSLIEEEQAFSVPTLIPSDWKRVLDHLRLPDTINEERLQLSTENAAVELLVQEGFVEAFRRLASLPMPLPKSIIDHFVSLPEGEQKAVVRNLIRSAGTPLTRVHLARLLCASEDSAFHRLAIRVARWLITSRGEFSAFIEVISWVEEESSRSMRVRSLCEPLRLALVWLHGSELSRLLFSINRDYVQLKKLFSRLVVPISPEAIKRNYAYWDDVAHPKKVTQTEFLVFALEYAFDGRYELISNLQCMDKLKKEAFTEEGGRLWPDPKIMRDNELLCDSMGSIFAGAISSKIARIFGDDFGESLTSENLREWSSGVLANIAERKDVVFSWLIWNAIIDGMTPYAECVAQLIEVIKTTPFHVESELGIGRGAIPMFCASLSLRHIKDPDAAARLEAELIEFAKRIGISKNYNEQTNDKNTLLFDIALNIALAEASDTTAAQKLASLMSAVCAKAPRCIPDAELIVQRFCDEFPTTLAIEFWPLLLTIRTS